MQEMLEKGIDFNNENEGEEGDYANDEDIDLWSQKADSSSNE